MSFKYRILKLARLNWLFAFIFIGTPVLELFSQKPNYRFYYYTADQGLSQNYVDCILKDSRNFMWFGTRNGLNRFDAYKFTVYKNGSSDENSVSNNFVHSLCEDKYGNIWIGTHEGLNLYLYEEDRFISFANDSVSDLPISSISVNTIISDHYGDLWVGTNNGILIITLKEDGNRIMSSKFLNSTREPGSLSGNIINCIYQDRHNRIWAGTDLGLNYYDRETASFTSYLHNPDNPGTISGNDVSAIYLDKNDNLWVGTRQGLNRYDIKNELFEHYIHDPGQPTSVAHNIISSITEDVKGSLLIGTLGGLSIYNENDNNFFNYIHDLYSSHGINNEFINSMLADDQGNVWIGTERGGINRYNIFQNEFEYYQHIPGNNQGLSHNTVNSVMEDEENLWVGTAGGGLIKLNKKNGRYSWYYPVQDDPNSLNSNFITCIFRDIQKNMWVGTWGSGLNFLKYGPEHSGNFYHFTNQPEDSNSLSDNYISAITQDISGNLWIASRGGIMQHTPGSANFKLISGHNPRVFISRAGCLKFDLNGNLWVGTEEGLFKLAPKNNSPLDPEDCSITRYLKSDSKAGSISGNYIISIHIDIRGNCWFGTYGDGLNKLVTDPLTGRESFINYTTEHGLVNNIVYGILEDEDGNLWLSTDNGLSKFNLTNNEFTNYSISDGLLTNQFYWSACFKNDSGRMYFGGMNGLLTFEPGKIIARDFRHNLSLTSFKIYNQPVVAGKEYYDQVLIDRSVSRIEKICLPYKIKEFSMEFSALNYHQTDKIQYAYMLEGFDEEWNYVGADRRFVSYTNLKGGDYRLIIKTSLKEGKWSDQPLFVAIQIIPPVWEQWWFITLALSLIVFSIIGYNWYRTFALKKRKRILEILVKERTYQIEGQKEQLEMKSLEIIEQRDKLMALNKKVQEANRNQMRFFTHMTHEFRTPLMLIISPLEDLTRKMPEVSGNVLNKLVLMKKNAKRLLHLVNQLMEVRRIKTGNIELKVSETDLVKFLENISQPFNSLASQKNISYDFVSFEKSIITYADTEKLEVIFYNLLFNAIKYTPEYGYINIEIKLTGNGAVNETMQDEIPVLKQKPETGYRYISITVSDSGIGIEREHLKEIFKRFYKAPSEYNKYSYGTGIGLYLAKELIKAHRGFLYVRSKPGEGSSFRFLIPYGKQYFKEYEISEKQNSSPFKKYENLQASILDEYLENTREKRPSHSTITEKQIIAKPLILIVDDDPELCDYFAGFFADEFEILVAENGEDGLEKAKKYFPDLILSDNMMPKMDGYELCSQIKSDIQTSHIPFIIISARSDEESMIEGLEAGADDYIVKPFELNVLEVKIRTIIENRNKLKRIFSSSLISDLKKVSISAVDNKFLKQAIDIVERNMINSEFGVQQLAEQLNISRSLLHKKLTALIDHSANDFITSVRLKQSAKLILEGRLKISEIAYQVGFNDPKYFTRCFKKHFKKTPSEYFREQV